MAVKIKRMIAVLMAVCLVFTTLPSSFGTATANAAETETTIFDVGSGEDAYHTELYYLLKDKLGDVERSDWGKVVDAIEDYKNNMEPEERNALEEKTWNWVFDEVIVPSGITVTENIPFTQKLTVASGAAITLSVQTYQDGDGGQHRDAQGFSIKGRGSEIAGDIVIENSDLKNENYVEGENDPRDEYVVNGVFLEDDAEATITETGSVTAIGNGTFELGWDADLTVDGTLTLDDSEMRLNDSAVLNINGTVNTIGDGRILTHLHVLVNVNGKPLVAKGALRGDEVTFDGKQDWDYTLRYVDGEWLFDQREIKTEIELPADFDDFYYARDEWSRTHNEEDEDFLVFDKVTITENLYFADGFDTKELVVNEGVKFTIVTGKDDPSGDEWGNFIWAGKATIAGTLVIEDSKVINPCYNPDDEWDSEYQLNNVQFAALTVTGNGKVIAKGNGLLGWDNSVPVTIIVPSYDAIDSEATIGFGPNVTIKVGGAYWKPVVKSSNPGDEAVHEIVYDGSNEGWTNNVTIKNGKWEIGEEGAPWWGEPFENEARLYFDDDCSIKVDGNVIGKDDFITFEAGKPVEFEIVPPSGFSGTPVVIISNGYYNKEDGLTGYRSDDFKTSDLWFTKVKKVTVTNNKVSFTPESSEPLSIQIFLDPEDIMEMAIDDLEGRYFWAGEFDKDGNWIWGEGTPNNPDTDNQGYGPTKGWAAVGNEFMVEVSTTGNGEATLTPGFDFYRLGNKVKALYQGYELISGSKSVDVVLTPADGYELSRITIDGTSYVPSAVSGLTEANGVYTYKITKTPTKASNVVGNRRVEGLVFRDNVKITTIEAVFTQKSSSSGSGSSSGSSSSGSGYSGGSTTIIEPTVTEPTVTEPTTTEPTTTEPTTTEPTVTTEPEVTITVEEGDDGEVITTTVTEEADGTVTTEVETVEEDGTKIVETVEEKADGSKTEEKLTENTDGSSTKTTTEYNSKGKVVSTEVAQTAVSDAGTVTTTTVKVTSKTTTLTVDTTKTDGTEVSKEFQISKDGVVKVTEYDTAAKSVTIPGSVKGNGEKYAVTTIGKNAMSGNTNIKKVTVTKGITTIGTGAFAGDSNLSKIVLPGTITKISKDAFDGIKEGATFVIKATKKEFKKIKKLLKKSGLDLSQYTIERK